MAAALALQCRRQFAEADIAVAVGVELVEDAVGLRGIGAAGAERVFNSDFEIWPSPLPSICENRSCSAADWLVGVDVAVVVDWLCAASNACIVAGDICEPPPENPVVVEPLAAALEAWLEASKDSPKPVEEALDLVEEVLVEEVADEVSD
jgi:hypothetical protein